MPAARAVWPKLSPAFVKDQLAGHKVLGLWLAALMYLVCVSGTAAVFYQDLERWEKPALPEMSEASPEAVARVVADGRARMLADPPKNPLFEDLFVVLPTPQLPRLTASYGEVAQAYDAAGAPAGDAGHPITHFLVELHYQLHIPGGVGLLLVGLLGVGLLALIVGGLLAHPRILKDAFLLRPSAGRRLALTDVHNRLGVWAAPFHIAIALTGAVIGLAQVVGFALALAVHGGDVTKAFEPVFGTEAETRALMGGARLADGAVLRALSEMQAKAPEARPMWVVLHKAGKPDEHLEITAIPPQSTAYGEIFRFDAQGRLHARAGLDDGPAGKQAYASLYPLHFGSFGGIWVKVAYAVLGLGLCVICATGMDIWLVKSAERGRPRPRLHRIWTVFVWGMPAALPLAASAYLLLGWSPVAVFWALLATAGVGAGALAAVSQAPQPVWSAAAKAVFALSLLLLPLAHLAVFRSVAPAALGPSLVMTLMGLALAGNVLWPAVRRNRLATAFERAGG
ncbi:PepSY-associated TM helix domain-containing protein [Phenylobacterium sp.]|uniref:PepSY-associated TM helix domain-containing protein n=1 Tax=Phenylobacterium sp. TaxID=1871053 RepID=UPI0035B3168C